MQRLLNSVTIADIAMMLTTVTIMMTMIVVIIVTVIITLSSSSCQKKETLGTAATIEGSCSCQRQPRFSTGFYWRG